MSSSIKEDLESVEFEFESANRATIMESSLQHTQTAQIYATVALTKAVVELTKIIKGGQQRVSGKR